MNSNKFGVTVPRKTAVLLTSENRCSFPLIYFVTLTACISLMELVIRSSEKSTKGAQQNFCTLSQLGTMTNQLLIMAIYCCVGHLVRGGSRHWAGLAHAQLKWLESDFDKRSITSLVASLVVG